MPNIVLYLSGRWPASKAPALCDDDLFFYAPNVSPPDTGHDWQPISERSSKADSEIASWLNEEVNQIADPLLSSVLDSFLCEYLHYTLTPAAVLIKQIEHCCEAAKPDKIIVICSSTIGGLPMLGFQTAESKRGSADLLYSRIANLLPIIFADKSFEFVQTKGDFWLCEPLRRVILKCANIAFTLLFFFRILSLNFWTKKTKKFAGNRMIIFMRVRHQLRFVNMLFDSGIKADIMLIPQLTQGSLRADKQMIETINQGAVRQTISPKLLLRAIRSTFRDTRSLKKISARLPKTRGFPIAGRHIPLSWEYFTREILLASVTILHKNIIAEVLKVGNYKRLLNFELVGRFAGLEYAAAQEVGVKAVTLQTAIISDRPHPIFPVSDFFYADSPSNAGMLSSIGTTKNGTVLFAGYPYTIKSIETDGAIKDISFFTQPYETSVSQRILSVVAEHASQKGMSLKIRLHPRDRGQHYDALQKQWPQTIGVLPSGNLSRALAESDLCITRTSSVAKEALATGKPIILTMWTEFDQSVRGDYISDDASLDYRALDADDLKRMLNDLQSVQASATELHRQLFAGGSTADLVSSINSL